MATTLEARAANEPETQATLRNYWHPLCMSEDVVEQPRGYMLLDESIVAFRDANGVAAFRVRWEYTLFTPFTIHLKKITPDGQETLISLMSAPTSTRETELFLFVLRNYDLDGDDQQYQDFSDTIMEQDRRIVESQRPEEIPTDLRDELHLKVPDASGIAYRKLLGRIAGVSPFLP